MKMTTKNQTRLLLITGLACLVMCTTTPAQAQYFTPWKMMTQPKIIPFTSVSPRHGHISEYDVAPSIPAQDAAGWQNTPHPRDINFQKPSRHVGQPKDCLVAGDFNLYQTTIVLPKQATLKTFVLRAWALDDAMRVTIYNSAHPKGVTPQAGYLSIFDSRTTEPMAGSAETGNLATYLRAGESNRLVITHVDDCATMMVLQRVEFLLNGTTIRYNTPPAFHTHPPTHARPSHIYTYPIRIKQPDNEPLTFTLERAPAGMTFDKTTQTITWTPTENDLGLSKKVTVRVCDTQNGCDTQTWDIKVQIQSPNRLPVITSSPTYVQRYGLLYTYTVIATDEDQWDQGNLTFRLASGPTNATLDTKTGKLEWTPTPQDVGKLHLFKVEACDVEGSCTHQEWNTFIRAIAKAKLKTEPIPFGFVGHTYKYTPALINTDKGAKYTWKYLLGPNVTFQPATGQIVWVIGPSHAGKTVDFKIQVCNQLNICTTQSWSVKIAQTHLEFWLQNGPTVNINYGETYTYSARAVPYWQGVSYTLNRGPAGAVLKDGILTWTPTAAQVNQGIDFQITLCEAAVRCATLKWTVNVLQPNRPPIILSTAPTTGHERRVYTYSLQTKDPDPTDIFRWYQLTKAPKGASINLLTGQINWVPEIGMSATPHTFQVEVCDIKEACTSQSWKVSLTAFPFRLASTAGDTAIPGQEYTYTPNVTSIAGTPLTATWRLKRGPDTAQLSPSTGTLTWTPKEADQNKMQAFILEACIDADCLEQIWTVAVGKAPDSPVPPTPEAPSFTSTPPLNATAETEYIYQITVAHPSADTNVTVTWQINEGDATITANDKRTFTVMWTPTTAHAGRTLSFTLRACVETACTKQSWTLTPKSPTPKPECQSDNDCQEGKQCMAGNCILKSTGTVTNPPANEIEIGHKNTTPTPGPNIQAVGCACTSTQPPAHTTEWIGMFLLLALIGKLRRSQK